MVQGAAYILPLQVDTCVCILQYHNIQEHLAVEETVLTNAILQYFNGPPGVLATNYCQWYLSSKFKTKSIVTSVSENTCTVCTVRTDV